MDPLSTSLNQRGTRDPLTTVLLACGAIAAPLFVLAFLVLRRDRVHYDPLRHPVSSLAIGEYGWLQQANFLITGGLLLAFAFGLRRVLQPRGGAGWGPVLIGLVAIGLLGAGVFISDPLNGYPPGTPARPMPRSLHGALHDRFSALVFVGLPAACFVFARRFAGWGDRWWAQYSALTGAAFVVSFVLTSLGFGQIGAFVAVAGVLQRVTLVIGWTWLAVLAVSLLRSAAPERRAPPT